MKLIRLLALLSAGCFLSRAILHAGDNPALSTNTVPEGWSVHCSVEKIKFAVGEPITLLVVCSNQSTKQGIFTERVPLAVHMLEVKTSTGTPADMTDFGKRMSPPFGISNVRALPIPPNTSLTNTIDLNQTFELKKAGHYSITAICRIMEDGANKAVFIVKSPPLDIEISQ